MKTLTTFIIGLAIVMTSFGTAEARHANGLEGLLLGSAGGAVIGHAIDRSPEGVIFGSVIGGTLGMLIDISSDRDHVLVLNSRHHRPQTDYLYNNHRDRRHERWSGRKHRRHERRWRRERRHHRR